MRITERINSSKHFFIGIFILILLISIIRAQLFSTVSNNMIKIRRTHDERLKDEDISNKEIDSTSISRSLTQHQSNFTSKRIDFTLDKHPDASFYITDVPETIEHLAVIDLNNDSSPDVVASSTTTVYFLNGITGEVLYTSETFSMINSQVVSDFSNDSVPDVAIGTIFGGIYFLDGTNGNTIYNNSNVGNITALTAGDWTNDSIPDVAVGLENGTIFFLNGTDGNILYKNNTGAYIHTFTVADFNDDHFSDVAAGTSSGIVILNGATGEILHNIGGLNDIHALVVADFNSDTIPDLAGGGSSGYVSFVNGLTGGILYNPDLGFSITTLTVGEWSLDSIPDVIVGGDNDTVIFLNGATGNLLDTSKVAEMVKTLVLCDWNNDSTVDVVVGTITGGIYYIDGNTRKIFHTTLTIGEVGILKVSDFDKDKIDDIITAGLRNIQIIFSDVTAPIFNHVLLPEVTTSEEILNFQLFFDEPNLDSILMGYLDETNTSKFLSPTKYEQGAVTFTIPYFENPTLYFWFWANDTWSNVKIAGNETNNFHLLVYQRNIISNYESSRDEIHSLVVADFTNDSVPDIAAAVSSGNPCIYFVDGATGETIANFSEILPSDEMINKIVEIDWKNGSVPDIVAASSKGNLFIIDSTTGDLIHKNNLSTDSLNVLTVTDFSKDTIPDIVTGSFGQVYFINSTSGGLLYTSNITEGKIDHIGVGDFNDDNTPDITVTSYRESTGRSPGDSTIHFLNGSSGAELYNYYLPNLEITTLTVGHISNDSIPDVVVGTTLGDVEIINGRTGFLHLSIGLTEQIDAIGLNDYNNDNMEEIIVATVTNRIFIFDGATGNELFNTTIFDDIISGEPVKMIIGDLTRDNNSDIAVSRKGWQGVYYIDGFTGEINSIIYEELVTSNVLLEDFDQNGVVDIALGDQNGRIFVIQNLKLMYNLRTTVKSPISITQDSKVPTEISVNLYDFYNNPIPNAQVNLIAQKTGTNLFFTIGGQDLGNGTYQYIFTTENWLVGEWDLFSTVGISPYESIDLKDYKHWIGNHLPQKRIMVIGEAIPTITASAEGASFSPGPRILEDVVEGSIITLDMKVHDIYAHTLGSNEVSITVRFNEENFTATATEEELFTVSLPTVNLKHGTYETEVILEGKYLETSFSTLSIMIIPQFPSITISTDNLYAIALAAFIFTLILSKGLRMTYARLQSKPERAGWVLNVLMMLSTLALLGVLAAWYYLLTTTPIWSFLVLLLAIGLVLTLFALYFFKIVHSQIIKMQFSRRNFYGTAVFVGLIAFLLALIFIIASEIQWFDYYVVQTKRDLYIISIPQIYYDIGIIAFSLGFLLIVISTILRTRGNIKYLEEVKREVSEGYYPKHRNYLDTKKGDLLRDHFFLMTRSFIFWYAIIIVTFIISFEIYEFIPIFAVILVPAVLAFLLVFRDFVIDVILDLLWYA